MSNEIVDRNIKFMELGGQTTDVLNLEQFTLYQRLINEEVNEEFFAHIENIKENPERYMLDDEFVGLLDDLGDSIVVCMGAISSLGVDIGDLMKVIQTANLNKVTGDKVLKDPEGKIIKSREWKIANRESQRLGILALVEKVKR